MANVSEHQKKWMHNRRFLSAVGDPAFDDWRCTIAFYACVHAVEALFARDDNHDSPSHVARNKRLKQHPKNYVAIWHNYKHLWNASLVARYMCDEQGSIIPDFFSWITEADVRDILIKRHMLEVEREVIARLQLKSDDFYPLS